MQSGERYSSGPDLAGPPGRASEAPRLRPGDGPQHPCSLGGAPLVDCSGVDRRRRGVARAALSDLAQLPAGLGRGEQCSAGVGPAPRQPAAARLDRWRRDLLYVRIAAVLDHRDSFPGCTASTIHLGAALTCLIVVASAVALARMGSRGMSTAVRCAVVVAVLAVPLLTPAGVNTLVELPDHTGTTAIILV